MPYRDKADRAANDRKRKARDPNKFAVWNAAYRERNRETLAARQREWNALNPDKIKAMNLSKYGLTLSAFKRMLRSQDYTCAICPTEIKAGVNGKRAACVDHCHKTGVVRGLLCTRCNLGLGMFRDSPRRLRMAVQYLQAYRTRVGIRRSK